MLLDMLTGGFGNLIDIWIFYRILNFFPFELLTKRHKNGDFKAKYRQKYITWDTQTTLHWKSNVSPVKLCNKILGQLKLWNLRTRSLSCGFVNKHRRPNYRNNVKITMH